MKIWKYILSVAALLSMGACNHDADPMVIPQRDLDIANHSALVVNDLTADEEFTLTWTAAKFGIQTDVEYTVAAAVDSNAAVTLGTTANLYYTTTNGALLEALGLALGGSYNVTFTVTAAAVETEETCEDTIAMALTIDKEAHMWIIGAYQGWDHKKPSSRLIQGEDGILRGFVNILSDTEGGNEVKFCTQENWNGTNYGMKDGALSTDPEAGNIVLTKGLHYLHFDAKNMTLVDIPLTKVALIGEAVGGWDKDYAEFTFNAENNVWTAVCENVVKDKEYKIRFNGVWDVVDAAGAGYNISLGGEFGNLAMGGGNLKAQNNGKVTFTLNLFDAPYTLTEVGPIPSQLHIIGAYQGWDHSKPHSDLVKQGDGKLTGFLNITSADAAAFKFCTDLNWNGINYGMQDGVISTDGGASDITLEVGLHYLVFDMEAMTLTTTTITKVGLIGNGEAFGNWGNDGGVDVEMTYNATTQTWSATVANVPANNEYKVRFNSDWSLNLGGDAANLTYGGDNLKTTKDGSVTFELNIFSTPYTIVEK